MARQGRCSASLVVLASTLLVITISLHFKTTQAANFTVGDTSGWTFNTQSWADGKKFKAGDMLIFNYDPSLHDVATVDDASSYDGCATSPTSTIYTSGKDTVKLKKGQNYFICSIPSHCDWGLKLAVNASS